MNITTDTAVERAMIVHINGRSLKFKECNQGLYYLELSTYKLNSTINDYSTLSTCKNVNLLQSINNNKSIYTKEEIKLADTARKTQEQMG